MAFTYDLTTERGQVRLRLSDTDSTSYVFEDAEVDYFLTAGGSVGAAVVEGAKVLIASHARRSRYFAVQGVTFDNRQQLASLQALIDEYGGHAATMNSTLPAAMPFDEAYVRPTT